jgi:hypothetical protein
MAIIIVPICTGNHRLSTLPPATIKLTYYEATIYFALRNQIKLGHCGLQIRPLGVETGQHRFPVSRARAIHTRRWQRLHSFRAPYLGRLRNRPERALMGYDAPLPPDHVNLISDVVSAIF